MTDREAMQQALDALELLARYENPATKVQVRKPRNGGPIVTMYPHKVATEAAAPLRERLAQPEQEFTTHEEGEDGWSDWVCPDPKGYLMKCCDCGLVHEAQFKVVRYKSEAEREDCEPVDDPNLQAVFRMRRSEEWTPDDTAYRPGGLAQPEQEPVATVRCINGITIGYLEVMQPVGTKLYTTPPQRKPLTEKRIEELYSFWVVDCQDIVGFARAVERTVKGEA